MICRDNSDQLFPVNPGISIRNTAFTLLVLTFSLLFVSSLLGGDSPAIALKPAGTIEMSKTVIKAPNTPAGVDASNCSTIGYAGNPVDYWSIPFGNITAFAMRFTPWGADTLKEVDILVWDPGDGSYGDDSFKVVVYGDDGSGLPGAALATKMVSPGSYTKYPDTTKVNFSTFNLIFYHDFYVGVSTSAAVGSGRWESIFSDDGTTGTGRSSYFGLGQWHSFAGTGDEDFNFHIWVKMCRSICNANGDANNNGIGLTSADLIYLATYINACGPAPIPLYSCDLNGDGSVNSADLQLYQSYFVYGMSVFAPYGGYPVLCPCDPTPAPKPDSVRIFGIDHVSGGTACFDTSGGVLKVSRIAEEPRDTLVDANGDTIIVIIHPNKGRSGGGPYNSSKSNLEDAGVAWSGDYEEDSTFGAGATLEEEVYGIVNGHSGQIAASSVQTKQANGSWALGVKAAVTSYTVKAYLHGALVKIVSNIAASGVWFQVGRFSHGARAESGGGPYNSSKSNLEDAGIIVNEWESKDTVTWNWGSHGVSGLHIDALRIEGKTDNQAKVGYLTSVAQYAMKIPSFTVTSESQSMDYGGIAITSLGDAIVTPVDTTLVVSNIGSSHLDGADAEKKDDDGDWAIVWKNPDQSGTLPVGASLETEFFFPTPTHPDSLSMALSMTKAAANTWNLAIQSIASTYTIQAFNNGSSVFSAVGISATGLGYIVETARGVYPVGFKGGASGKPASVIASSAYDFTVSPSGVLWTWAGHGVSSLPIDYLSISTEVPGTSLLGVTHAEMCGANGGKAAPISFTILNIDFVPSYVCGDANGDGTVNISDAVYLIQYIFSGGPAPNPLVAGDSNCDGTTNISDAVYLITYIFSHGPAPCAACK